MISIDTNILIRLLTNDDKKQAKYAEKLVESNDIYITKSVLMEAEWVLRYTYEIEPTIIHQAFENLLGLPQITVEDPACIIKTMNWYAEGFDFADAMHLATSLQSSDKFATLDKGFIKLAKKMNIHLITMT